LGLIAKYITNQLEDILWEIKNVKSLGKYKIFELFQEKVINPRNNKLLDFLYLKLSDWTVVVPITRDNHIIMVKQYRIGAKKYFYEFPGGLIDRGEEPLHAAKRELSEETGYYSDKFTLLTEVYPLPAFQTSKCFIYLAEEVEFKSEINLDDGEDIETVVFTLDEVKEMIKNNKIDNAIMMLAFLTFLQK
jgi:ADP-ribose pyrophosphatase